MCNLFTTLCSRRLADSLLKPKEPSITLLSPPAFKEFICHKSNQVTKYQPVEKHQEPLVIKSRSIRPYLGIFDFHGTLVDGSPEAVFAGMFDDSIHYMNGIRKSKQQLQLRTGWIEYMQETYRMAHQHKVTRQDISSIMRDLPEVPGAVDLLQRIYSYHDFDLAICSNGYSACIAEWLAERELLEKFEAIYANPSYFDGRGQYFIEGLMAQRFCKLCPRNLCKGYVMEEFITDQAKRKNVHYCCVVYIGGSRTGYCTLKKLVCSDVACVRRGYPLERILKHWRHLIAADVIYWDTGYDLITELDKYLKQRVWR